MTQKAKLVAKIRRNPRNVSRADFEALARYYGSIEEGGKHPMILIGMHQPLTYKRENPVKSCYVHELLEIIDEVGRKTAH